MSDTSESVIEEIIENLPRHAVRHEAILLPQYWVSTTIGNFRTDFAIQSPSRTIAIECDGTAFHDAYRDEIRDAAILSQTLIDTIYRIPGTLALDHHIDCVAIIALLEADLFDPNWVIRHHAAISFDTSEVTVERLRMMDAEITVESFSSMGYRRSIGLCSRVRYNAHHRYFWRTIATKLEHDELGSIDNYLAVAEVERAAFLGGSK